MKIKAVKGLFLVERGGGKKRRKKEERKNQLLIHMYEQNRKTNH
jgi:hypothetical protein